MTRAVSTYFQFLDIIFGQLSLINKVLKIQIIISIEKNTSFRLYMNNHLSLAKIFKNMFWFLHKNYFLFVTFKPIYLLKKKLLYLIIS